MTRAIVLHSRDNVATLIDEGVLGTTAELTGAGAGRIELIVNIPYGHKCAIVALRRGSDIVKYGQIIGHAASDIAVGDHVHIHNVTAIPARG